ncbi:MAG: OmpA family protein [Alphaproteobacteria bacterium]
MKRLGSRHGALPSWRAGGSAHDPDQDAWFISFADLVTLLLAFFIAIAAFSRLDESFLDKLAASFNASVGVGAVSKHSGADLAATLRTTLAELPFGRDAGLVEGNGRVAIEIADGVLFRPGSAELEPDAVTALRAIADVLRADDFRRAAITVEGHTDDQPITTTRFPSNWELSAARAIAVVRLLEAFGVAPWRLEAAAYGATRPKLPNRDQAGVPIPANQAQNRRIVIVATR